MQEFDKIGEDLFNKIRGRFSEVTIGDETGTVTNEPTMARFFDFNYNGLGKVSVSLDEDEGLSVIYSKDFMEDQDEMTQDVWYDFLKELRIFSKKRMLEFSIRDITKSNLTKRDYKFLAKTPEDGQMTESKLYGTSKVSYQKVGEARIVIQHTESINQESATGRTQKIGKIYIESADGERFRYPFKHLSGARAMARHVAEGGNTYDDFGKHIVGLSEEMGKLRKFKNYMGRSAVMAESLAGYVDVVKERISTVKKTIESLQKPAYYAETVAAFETPMMEDVPADVAENWIDQLTIKQFNEELADVFPYIYKLVSEATKAKEIGPDDLVDEGERHGNSKIYDKCRDGWKKKPGATRGSKGSCIPEEIALEQGFEEMMGQFGEAVVDGEITKDSVKKSALELLVDIAKTSKQYKGEVTDDQVHYLGSLVQDFDMAGIETEKYSEIEKLFRTASKTNKADMSMIQPAYAQAKELDEDAIGESEYDSSDIMSEDPPIGVDFDMDNISKVDWSKHSPEEIKRFYSTIDNLDYEDGVDVSGTGYSGEYAKAVKWLDDNVMNKLNSDKDDDTDEAVDTQEQKTPLGEFILSYFDRETGVFPKGETAVLTMVEKDYGEQFIEPAKAFIEQVSSKFEEFQMRTQPQQMEAPDTGDYDRMRELAGLR